MFKYFGILVIAIIAISLASCETDFNPNADYKDITVVYGLLNQSDTFTYIKINKAFLGNASAYVMAQNEDLSNYGKDIDVKMDELVDGSPVAELQFDTSTVYNKEPGIFYAPKQVLYRCNTFHKLNEGSTYNLIIKNIKTGKIITAQTSLVNRFDITSPSSMQTAIDFSTSTIGRSKIEWISSNGAKKYEISMRINYSESYDQISYVSKYLDVNLGSITRTTTEGGTEMQSEYYGLIFYETLKNNLIASTTANPIYRKPGKVEVIISVAADDLSTYIDVNAPSNSIVQVRPEFTNVNNGIGIFSARYNTAVDHPRKMDLGVKSKTILHEQYPALGF